MSRERTSIDVMIALVILWFILVTLYVVSLDNQIQGVRDRVMILEATEAPF